MIKFFRHIRRSLIQENNMGKYFKYAIGEVLLVVIGILIALQINSWHQGNLRLKQEKILLKQLRFELLEVYDDIFADYYDLSRAERSHFEVLETIEQNLPYTDTLAFDFYFLKLDEYVYPNTAVYEKIKELGLDIIKSDTLRSDIQLLYDHILPRISKANSFTRDIGEYLDPYFIEHFKPNDNFEIHLFRSREFDTLSGRVYKSRLFDFPQEFVIQGIKRKINLGFIPNDFEALKKDQRFLMLLNEADSNRTYKLWRYTEAKDKIKYMVRLIDKLLADD